MTDAMRIFVPAELFAPAESSHFEGEAPLPVLTAGPDRYEFAGPLAWQVDVTNTGGALLVAGSVAGEAKGACARCLEEFTLPLCGEVEGYFLIGPDEEAPEGWDEDEFDVLPENHVIDLEPLIVAALLLELPLVPLCDDECKGLCYRCGANLNEGPCGCAPQIEGEGASGGESDAPADGRNPFAVLKGYRFDG